MATSAAARREFLLPDLGEGLTEAEVASWLVDVGDRVEVDQPVAEVETAKAVVEVPCPFAGVVVELHAEVGGEVVVGTPLITIETGAPSETGDPDETRGPQPVQAAPEVPAGGGEAAGGAPEPEDQLEPEDAAEDEEAEDADGSGNVLVGYGTAGGGRARRRRPAPAATAPEAPRRPLAKPPVRKLAKDLGVDLAQVTPSGDGGVVTRDDVRAHAEQDAAARPAPAATGDRAARRVPLRGVRKLIAERMTTSRREIPEATTWVDCDATALMAMRAEMNASADVRVSPLALVLRACVAGLRRVPQLNASIDEQAGEIVLHEAVSLGVATHTDRGLVVPVIRDAHELSTLQIAEALNDLAARARDATIEPRELVGSTFTVSNYGAFGVDGGNPVINHPEAAILGVGQIAERPWVVEGQLAVRSVVQLSLAFDHRIVDGGEAADFLRFVADCVERPSTLLAHV